MCGIVGAFTFGDINKEEQKIITDALTFITTELLEITEERGKDATGVVTLFEDGNFNGIKMGIPSPEFIARFTQKENEFAGFLKVWREYEPVMRAYMGHCRKSTVGNTYDNNNNHPIKVDDVVIIHNGTIDNPDTIFKKLGCPRDGTVDSEAIARLVHHFTENG
ncbi:MAG: hypothetical protein PVG39_18410, partial [Desulfobacteraceae bacterium]